MATDKQVNYIMLLLGKAGYSTRWMNARYANLGATMRERSGKVEDWVRSRNISEANKLIDLLKEKIGE